MFKDKIFEQTQSEILFAIGNVNKLVGITSYPYIIAHTKKIISNPMALSFFYKCIVITFLNSHIPT